MKKKGNSVTTNRQESDHKKKNNKKVNCIAIKLMFHSSTGNYSTKNCMPEDAAEVRTYEGLKHERKQQ